MAVMFVGVAASEVSVVVLLSLVVAVPCQGEKAQVQHDAAVEILCLVAAVRDDEMWVRTIQRQQQQQQLDFEEEPSVGS